MQRQNPLPGTEEDGEAALNPPATGIGGRQAKVQMTDLDWAILNQLTQEPHMTSREIAENLGTTSNQVVARLRKLDRKNAFHVMAALDLKALGQSFCFAMIETRGPTLASIADAICAIPEVMMACSSLGHGPSLVLAVRFKDQNDLMTILYQKIARVPGVYHIETSIVLEAPVFHALYMDFVSSTAFDDVDKLKSEVKAIFGDELIDDIDAGIIAELQQDGRRSIRSVARKHGLNAGTVRYRIRSLESRGLIHFVTMLNPYVVSYGKFAMLKMNVEGHAIDDVIGQLSGLRWLPQLFLCAGASTLIGIVLTDSMETLVDIKGSIVDPIDGVIDAEIVPLITVYRMEGRWAQKAKQQID